MSLDTLTSDPDRVVEFPRYGRLDAAMEAEFVEIEELAAQICKTPLALVTLPEGLESHDSGKTRLASALYQQALMQKAGLFVVSDMASDERLRDHVLTFDGLPLRFCACEVLKSNKGVLLGALCVLDHLPRELTPPQARALGILSRQVVTKLELLVARQRLQASEERFLSFMAHSPAACWIAEADGRLQYVSPGYYTMFGIKEAEVTGRFIQDLFEPELTHLYLENNRTVLRQQSVMESVEPGVRWDGSAGEFLSVRFPITLPGREPMVGGIALDTTARKRAEETLRESEMRFRSYFELPLNGIAITSPEKGWIEVNDHLCSLLGYSREELTRMTWSEMTYPDDLEPDVRQFTRLLAGEIEGYDMAKRFIRKDGRVIWTQLVVGCVRNPEGSVAYIVAVLSDITANKEAEEALRLSEQRFRQLAENVNEVFWITDPAMTEALYISPAYERVWQRPCATVYQSPSSWLMAIHPEDRERVAQAVRHKLPAAEYNETYRIIWPDGTIRWVHDRGYPVRNDHGEVYRMVGTAEDITERRQAEDKLWEQATLLDKAQDAIIVRDLEHHVHYWNRSAERLYGWTAEEAMGCSIKELLYSDPEPFLNATLAVMTKGEWIGEIHQRDKQGRALIVECRWTLVRDDLGHPKSILAINTDVTERKNLVQQLLRAQRMESIGTLAGGIAHDLNNVLAPIMMSIDLLRVGEGNKQRQAILSTIESSAKRGAEMVRQVLSFARGVTGQRIEVKAAHLLHEVEKIIQDTFPKNISVRSEKAEDLWVIQGDPTQLHQVLLNLCVNARDAMLDGGELTLWAKNELLDERCAEVNIEARPGPHVIIGVDDTGSGIPPDVLDRIFEPFFTTKDLGKGTGLGLSSTLAIVKSHGGFVRVSTEVGQGSQFRVYLPASSISESESIAPAKTDLPRGNGELVLLVDDEEGVREIVKHTLEAFGYRVLVARDGVEATTLYPLHREEIAVVLTDMMMPVMDGAETIRLLLGINPQVRIIAASGMGTNTMIARTQAAGVSHFLPKPYTAETLLQTLQVVLR